MYLFIQIHLWPTIVEVGCNNLPCREVCGLCRPKKNICERDGWCSCSHTRQRNIWLLGLKFLQCFMSSKYSNTLV